MRTNEDRLVMISAMGGITNPTVRPGGYRTTHDGRPVSGGSRTTCGWGTSWRSGTPTTPMDGCTGGAPSPSGSWCTLDCVVAGHGPGVTTLFSSSQPGALGYRIDPTANLADILGLPV